jgi:FKBP-type peptidyl-prolyl cis-trans isomerase (trigger factor)
VCIDQLVERLDFPLPEGLLKRNEEADADRLRNELTSQGADAAQIERQLLEAEGRLKQQSERKLRTSIVLDHIAVKEAVEVLNEEIETHFQLLSRTLRIPAQDLFDTFQSNGTLPEVVASMRRDKVRRLLRESSITSEMDEEEGSDESPSSTSTSEEETA